MVLFPRQGPLDLQNQSIMMLGRWLRMAPVASPARPALITRGVADGVADQGSPRALQRRMTYGVRVKNIPSDVFTPDKLKALFSKYGEIDDAFFLQVSSPFLLPAVVH